MSKKKKSSLKKKNLIHIKLEYSEAKQGKRNLLSSELNLLNALKHLSNYKELRSQELKKKKQILQIIKQTKIELGKLQMKLPKLKIPKILQKDHPEIKEEVNTHVSPIKKNQVESQLIEIQKKLKILEG